MTDDDRYDLWDEVDDGPELLTDESAMEWATNNRAELKTIFDSDGYYDAVLHAHATAFPRAEAELAKARQRTDEGEHAEAVFHAARALEGYVRAVYLTPLTNMMIEGIAAKLHTRSDIARKFIPNQIKDTAALLNLGLSVFFDDQPVVNRKRKEILRAFDPNGAWQHRNEADHSINDTERASAETMVAHATQHLPTISSVAAEILKARAEKEYRPPRAIAQPVRFLVMR